jgi:hypothetical protein
MPIANRESTTFLSILFRFVRTLALAAGGAACTLSKFGSSIHNTLNFREARICPHNNSCGGTASFDRQFDSSGSIEPPWATLQAPRTATEKVEALQLLLRRYLHLPLQTPKPAQSITRLAKHGCSKQRRANRSHLIPFHRQHLRNPQAIAAIPPKWNSDPAPHHHHLPSKPSSTLYPVESPP